MVELESFFGNVTSWKSGDTNLLIEFNKGWYYPENTETIS